MILVKNWQFLHLFMLGNIGRENVCHDILERKTRFNAIKQDIQKVEKVEFSKGVSPWFW